MKVFQRLAELPPTLRWHRSKLWTDLVLRRAFAHIGAGSVVVAPDKLRGVERISIGRNTSVQARTWMACEKGRSTITVGDNSSIGRDSHIHAAGDITIGSDVQIGPATLIISAAKAKDDLLEVVSLGPITIGDGVWIGERVSIIGGVTIGDRATIGAASVVTHDVPPGAVVAGVPARPVATRAS
ncbi:MAG TPA: acyltransferase [Acidimicrobiales bacterium]|nr:acyltransferase [Acidimicrobiales bacterium]